MAYVADLTSLAGKFDESAGMHIIDKLIGPSGAPRTTLIKASCILRLCPLAPVIHGEADRGVKPTTSLAHYQSFYANKYHDVEEHQFMHVLPTIDSSRIVTASNVA